MYIKNIKIGSATNSSSYHSTVTFSKDNLDKYGSQISDIFTINGLKYPGLALAYTKGFSQLNGHSTQKDANIFVNQVLSNVLEYWGKDIDWTPETSLPEDFLGKTAEALAIEYAVEYFEEKNIIPKKHYDGDNIVVICGTTE